MSDFETDSRGVPGIDYDGCEVCGDEFGWYGFIGFCIVCDKRICKDCRASCYWTRAKNKQCDHSDCYVPVCFECFLDVPDTYDYKIEE